MRIVITGAAGAIGRRVLPLMIEVMTDAEIVAVDRVVIAGAPVGVDTKIADMATADLGALFAGADVVVHLATVSSAGSLNPSDGDLELALVRRMLDGVDIAAVGHVVLLSTAMVYGAWSANPVPLTEDATIRPNPDFPWAVQRAEIERMAAEWSQSHPDVAVAILRPTAVVTSDDLGHLARALHEARVLLRADDGDPPVQYLHADDLGSAVVAVVHGRGEGAFNAAPDGWISPDGLDDLEGPKPRLRVPPWVARGFAAIRWKLGLAPTPPGVVPYTTQPWVVASDRLRSLGWRPVYSNEEAWVVSHDPGPLEVLPARKRQELALLVVGGVVAAGAVAAGVVVWRLRRRIRP